MSRRLLNFAYLGEHDPLLPQVCVVAECNDLADSNTGLLELRQFYEALAHHLVALFRIDAGLEGARERAP